MFVQIEGSVLLRTKQGVFREAMLALRGQDLYAIVAGGYVRLLQGNDTSNPNLRWTELLGIQHQSTDKFGRLQVVA